MYIARSVCVGRVLDEDYTRKGRAMPTLEGDALKLYIAAHGQARYDLYNDQSNTFHGSSPPPEGEAEDITYPAFSHRPEHDAESTFWTTLSGLLRAQPLDAPREKFASPVVAEVWRNLHGHLIPKHPDQYDDLRHHILVKNQGAWIKLFPEVMRDVAILMSNMARQVACEYALWEPQSKLEIDHLHEALQRLILQYLVDHRDKPIPLDPDNPRPTQGKRSEADATIFVTPRVTNTGDNTAAGPSSETTGSQRAGRRTSARVGSSSLRQRKSVTTSRATKAPAVVAGPSTTSRPTRERRSANARPKAVVAGPKRKTDSQGGRGSKRRKGPSGSAVSPREEDTDDENA